MSGLEALTNLRAHVARISTLDLSQIEAKFQEVTAGWESHETRFTGSRMRTVSPEVWEAANRACAPNADPETWRHHAHIGVFPTVKTGPIDEHCNRKNFGDGVCLYCKYTFVKLTENQLICGRLQAQGARGEGRGAG